MSLLLVIFYWIFLMLSLIFSLAVFVFGIISLVYLRRGAIFVPSFRDKVDQMIRLANLKPGMKVADLGSGDGRIVIAAGKLGVQADGFEINPVLVLWSRIKIKRQKLNNARVYFSDFWSADLSQYDVIIVFGITHIMEKLGLKLSKELKNGAVVISNAFRFPNLTEIQNQDSIHIYRKS